MLENKVEPDLVQRPIRAKLVEDPIEEVASKLRDMMPWIKRERWRNKSKN